jgi:urease accessory protein
MWRTSIFAMFGGVLATVMTASQAFAHPGGGTAGLLVGLTHPILGVDHVFAMVTVGILAMTMARPLAAPGAFVGAMTVGGALGIAGMALPGGEAAIAISVAALGGALIVGRAVGPEWSLALIGVAGFVHGHVHGVEAPTTAHIGFYVAGFVTATAALHLAGVGLGLVVRSRDIARTAIGALVFGAGAGLVAGFI